MKKHIILFALCCAMTLAAVASPLTPSEAVNRFMASQAGPVALRAAINNDSSSEDSFTNSGLKLRMTQRHLGADAVYLFSRGGGNGFLLLSADDSSAPLLGYSDSGSFPESDADISPDFRYWMEFLAAQVAKNADAGVAYEPAKVVGSAIAPMTQTRWNQDAPYFNDCPIAGTRHCYTGCVATAMSQVLKYHNYPATGTGSHKYIWANPVSGTDTTLSFDYASTTFDWDLMENVYNSESSEASKAEVAKLMLAAGIAVDMDYGLSGSGAAAMVIPHAMVEYFGYDKSIRQFYRDYYGIDAWNELVYQQLRDYGPLQYSGQSNDGGHSFVCDGYDGNGYFHINWGWGGMSDGYFLLTVLDPGTQGIGGSTSGYNFSQSVMGNVIPQASASSEIYPDFLGTEMGIREDSASLGDDIYVATGGFYNYSCGEIDQVTLGVKIISSTGATQYLVGGTVKGIGIGYGVGAYYVRLPEDLANGSYVVSLAYRDAKGTWYDTPIPVGVRDAYTMRVSNGTATFSPGVEADISITDLTNKTPFYIDQNFEVTAMVNNDSSMEYLHEVLVTLTTTTDATNIVAVGDYISLDIPANSQQEMQYLSQFESATSSALTAGTYNLYVSVKHGKTYTHLAGPMTINLQAAVDTEVKLTAFHITRTQYKDAIEASATVECTSGYYCGDISLAIAKNGSIIKWIYSDTIVLQADGEPEAQSVVTRAKLGDSVAEDTNFPSSTTVEFRGTFPEGTVGETYDVAVFKNSQQLSDVRAIDLQESISTLAVTAPSDIKSREFFTLDGLKLAPSSLDQSGTPLSEGIYIMRQTDGNGRVSTRPVLLRR